MKEEFFLKIKDILVIEREAILSKFNQDMDIDFEGDEMDEIQANLIASINSQISMLDKDKLKKIDNALSKISNGSFGECEDCGDQIAEKRLLANPKFSNCISCAENLEIELRKVRK